MITQTLALVITESIRRRVNAGDNRSALEEEPLLQEIKSLEALGLTRHQPQVAFWIAQGKTNDDLAIILNTSHHTIPHHVEAILARLHLATRAEITLWVLETLGWLRWPAKRRESARPSDRKDEKVASEDLASPKAKA
jgi:DNA-binding NarL/FixJ family response regulator